MVALTHGQMAMHQETAVFLFSPFLGEEGKEHHGRCLFNFIIQTRKIIYLSEYGYIKYIQYKITAGGHESVYPLLPQMKFIYTI